MTESFEQTLRRHVDTHCPGAKLMHDEATYDYIVRYKNAIHHFDKKDLATGNWDNIDARLRAVAKVGDGR